MDQIACQAPLCTNLSSDHWCAPTLLQTQFTEAVTVFSVKYCWVFPQYTAKSSNNLCGGFQSPHVLPHPTLTMQFKASCNIYRIRRRISESLKGINPIQINTDYLYSHKEICIPFLISSNMPVLLKTQPILWVTLHPMGYVAIMFLPWAPPGTLQSFPGIYENTLAQSSLWCLQALQLLNNVMVIY